MAGRSRKNLMLGLAFLTPNILGFLAFTLIPLVLSLVLAFSNWDLTQHNMFKDSRIRMVGLDNFTRLLSDADFYRYLGNTLFLMIGIPFGIAGSLLLATLLSRDLGRRRRRLFAWLLTSAVLVAACALLVVVGLGGSAMAILLTGLAGMLLVGGIVGGSAIYRTLFFLPSFTAGVAVYILWKKLYNPNNGPVNYALAGPLGGLTALVAATPGWVLAAGMWLLAALSAWLVFWGLGKLRRMWVDGDLGSPAALPPVAMILLPIVLVQGWLPGGYVSVALAVAVAAGLAWRITRAAKGRDFVAPAGTGFGTAAMLAIGLMVFQFVLLGLAKVVGSLPGMVAAAGPSGLESPKWLTDIHWAKPAIMIMGFWAAIGSRNMLLYLAGISNVPQSLYEAADIDGASPMQRFWNVTWPQLAPTTFFIVVMSVIGGLQGGFEMARTMTGGGPAGATTTLSYFIYNEGFETGRLGFSSAVAWTLFALVFVVTMINWKFGNRYVND